jgi:hypothetical protein
VRGFDGFEQNEIDATGPERECDHFLDILDRR